MEISASGAVAGYSGNAFKSDIKEETIMREELQTEMMMRTYIRGKIKKQLHEQKKREEQINRLVEIFDTHIKLDLILKP